MTRAVTTAAFGPRAWGRAGLPPILFLIVALGFAASPLAAAVDLAGALDETDPASLVPGAERFGPVEGTPPRAAAYRGDSVLGHVFLNTDVASAIGYSGKPIHLLIGLGTDGTVTGVTLYAHSEPIVLIGIPEAKVRSFIDGYLGRHVREFLKTRTSGDSALDIISGATVTILVIDDSIRRSVIKMGRALGIAGLKRESGSGTRARRALDLSQTGSDDWITLTGDGSVRRLTMSVGEVSADFLAAGKDVAASRPESKSPDDIFIDLYAAVVSVPVIGRSLLGDAEYANLTARLKTGEHAILIASNGLYSFKGSGYVRGGIFDRIQLIQGDASVRFRDRQHKRLGEVAAEFAQPFTEIGLFVVPAEAGFDAREPWRLQLLVQRAIGALTKDFLLYELAYSLPDRYLVPPVVEDARIEDAGIEDEAIDDGAETPLWRRIWDDRLVDVIVLGAAMALLTLIFLFQDWLVRRPKLAGGVRVGFLLFTVAWLGGYVQAQLSVVNTLTFSNALITDFRWEYFLMDPLIFVLWVGVAASLIFWGRGAYCGWLCPFGALQELLNKAAKLARVPQLTVPWGLHERLWPIKYVIFLGLFGVSLADLAFAEQLAEVEPFKTSVILRFVRDWPFVLYAGMLLFIGLFIERFFCRYLCPLGAALAIPGKLRTMEWLKRHKECGSPCHRCAQECMVQAIHPDGHINPNECLYCLHCQELYYDEHKCPAMIQRRLRRERRRARASRSIGAAPSHAVAGSSGDDSDPPTA